MNVQEITNLELLITEDCNLACRYCFHDRKSKNMSAETLDKALEFLAPYLLDTVNITFFGGEPMMREDFILSSAAKIKEIYPKCSFFVSTNATVFSFDIVNLLNSTPHSTLQISYDGLDQEELRGKCDLVRENIAKFIKWMKPDRISARMTFTPQTVDHLAENIAHMYDIGFRNVMHSAEYNNDWTQENLDEHVRQLDKIYDFLKQHGDYSVRFADCKSVKIKKGDAGCRMGKQMLSISADGDIYPCHRAVAHKEFRIGNVHEGRLNRGLFMNLRMDDCAECPAKGPCHTCFVANYEFAKDLKARLKCTCSINLAEYTKALEVYDDLFSGVDAIRKSMIPVLEDIQADSRLTLELINQGGM